MLTGQRNFGKISAQPHAYIMHPAEPCSSSVSFIVFFCEVKDCLVSFSVVENREQFLTVQATIQVGHHPLRPAVTVILSLVSPNLSFSAAFVNSQVVRLLLV